MINLCASRRTPRRSLRGDHLQFTLESEYALGLDMVHMHMVYPISRLVDEILLSQISAVLTWLGSNLRSLYYLEHAMPRKMVRCTSIPEE